MLRKLGKYELLQKLGAGSTSTVYLGRDPFARRDVAIKVAMPDILGHPHKGRVYSRLFLNEAALVGKLKHPHIVQIYDAVVAEKLCYIVMEYVAGGTLEDHAAPGRLLPVEQVVELIFKCTRALDFASRLGLTHRDIKPANLLLAGTGDIKISDFGTAIDRHRIDQTQVTGIGSPGYMSPEQVRQLELDPRTDIYSLGIVLFQLLTGQLPFSGDTPYQTLYQVVHQPMPRPSELRPGLPAGLDAIVARATAKERAERYPDWAAFAADLAGAAHRLQRQAPTPDLGDTAKFATLRALPFFAAFTDVEIWETLRFAEWQAVAAGQTLIRDGEPGEAFYFVVDGELAVDKHGKRLGLLKAGDCFGEMAVLSRQHPVRSADIAALGAGRVVRIADAALQRSSASCRMHFYQAFVEVLAERLALANRRLAEG